MQKPFHVPYLSYAAEKKLFIFSNHLHGVRQRMTIATGHKIENFGASGGHGLGAIKGGLAKGGQAY